MFTNKAKAKLRAGDALFGVFVRYPDAALVEVLALQGWDCIVIDGEHGIIEPRDCENMVRAAELRGATPIVRPSTNQPSVILRFMDTGAHGALVPWVNTAEEAESVVRSVKYWPRGQRGLAGVRANDYGLVAPLNETVAQSNAETLVIVQVETETAVDNLQSILAVDDVDVIFIGPNDLAQSLGLPGQTQHPRVVDAMQRVADQVNANEKALGIMVRDAAGARAWYEHGARFICCALESIITPASQAYLKLVREAENRF